MLSIGWVIFWKSIVVALWAALAEHWAEFRKRRAANGLQLKQNRRGVYVVSDWAARVENALRRAWNIALWLTIANMIFWLSLIAYTRFIR